MSVLAREPLLRQGDKYQNNLERGGQVRLVSEWICITRLEGCLRFMTGRLCHGLLCPQLPQNDCCTSIKDGKAQAG